jgi:hypothetical protein
MFWSEHYQGRNTGTVFQHINRLDIRTTFRLGVMILHHRLCWTTLKNRHTFLHCGLCSFNVLIVLIVHFFIMQAEIMEMQKNEVTVDSKLPVFDPCILSWRSFWFAKTLAEKYSACKHTTFSITLPITKDERMAWSKIHIIQIYSISLTLWVASCATNH